MATLGATASTTTFPATAADVGAEASGAVATHAGAADPHTGYQLESGLAAAITATKIDDLTAGDDNTDLNASTTKHGLLPKLDNVATNFLNGQGAWAAPAGGSGAPDDATYLVAAAHAGLSAEVAVGTSPGGELGGTWASPTVDATHSGSSHAGLSGQPGSTDVAVADGGTGAGTAADARTNLGLVIGTDVAAPARFGRVAFGGNTGYQMPGVVLTATTTFGPTVNTLYYVICWTPTAIVIDQVALNATTGPASNAKVRVGIYVAVDGQPSGNPLVDVEIAVTTAATGLKTAAASATIPAGAFVIAMNCDVTMSMRAYTGAYVGGLIDPTMGSGGQIMGGTVASAYGAMAAPGTVWTAIMASLSQHVIAIRVLTP